MKKLLATIAAVLISAATYAQGQVNFENFTLTPDVTIFLPDGTTGVGTDGRVQLFLNGAPLGTPVAFTDGTPGKFFGGIVTVPGMAIGASTAFQVRAWIGDSYDTAALRNEVMSQVATLGGDTVLPPNVQFASFALVPEPSTMVLGLLGAAALLFRRRK